MAGDTVAPGLLATGDAAALVNPFNGEGISYALESGELAGEALDRAFRDGRETPDLYPDLLRARYRRHVRLRDEFPRMFGMARLYDWQTPKSNEHTTPRPPADGVLAPCLRDVLSDHEPGSGGPLGALLWSGLRTDPELGPMLARIDTEVLDVAGSHTPLFGELALYARAGFLGLPGWLAMLIVSAASLDEPAGERERDLAVAAELLATSTLFHGDVLGGPSGPSLARAYTPMSILLGDTLVARLFDVMNRLDADTRATLSTDFREHVGRLLARRVVARVTLAPAQDGGDLAKLAGRLVALACGFRDAPASESQALVTWAGALSRAMELAHDAWIDIEGHALASENEPLYLARRGYRVAHAWEAKARGYDLVAALESATSTEDLQRAVGELVHRGAFDAVLRRARELVTGARTALAGVPRRRRGEWLARLTDNVSDVVARVERAVRERARPSSAARATQIANALRTGIHLEEDRMKPAGSLASASIPIDGASSRQLRMYAFGHREDAEVIALVHREPGDASDTALVRMHSACFTGDVLGSLRCDCGEQLATAIHEIQRSPFGVLIYFLTHEGRGIGLVNKLRAYQLQDDGLDTVQANLALGLPQDTRSFAAAAEILRSLGARRVRILTNNPAKVRALEETGIEVAEVVPLSVVANRYNAGYLEAKRLHFGHWVPPLVSEAPGAGVAAPVSIAQARRRSGGRARRADAPPIADAHEFTRHRGPVTGVASVPGTDWIASVAYDGAVGLFDVASGAVELLGYHEHLANGISADPRGGRIATCGADYTVRIWDVAARKLERVLLGHSDDVEAFVFIDGKFGASASRDRRIVLWNLETGAIVDVLEGHEKDVLSLACHGDLLLSSGDDTTLRAWDLRTGQQRRVFGPFAVETDTCAIDPVHDRLVLGCDDGAIRVFSLERGELTQEIAAHTVGIKKVSVSTATGEIVSGAYDQRVVVWTWVGDRLERRLEVSSSPMPWERTLTWSNDGRRLLGGTFDGTVLAWDAADGRLIRHIGAGAAPEGNACFNDVAASSGGVLALVSDDGHVRAASIDGTTMGWRAEAEPATGRTLMNGVAIDPSGRFVVGGTHDHAIHVWELEGGRLRSRAHAALGHGPINSIQIRAGDGEPEAFVGCYSGHVVRAGLDGSIHGHLRCHDGAVKAVRLHPTLPLGLSCAADGTLHAWNFDGHIRQRYLGHRAIINDLDVEPSAERVASVGRDFALNVFDLDRGTLLESFDLGRRSLKCVCFFDASTVLIGDYWGEVIRVSLETREVRRLRVAGNGLSAIKRAGDRVVTCSYDGGVYLLDPARLEVITVLRGMRQRLDEPEAEIVAPRTRVAM
ncbi:MAG: GTP cyclohydrolase II RibA [Deltaproteobacteria bacterium]|nr:GTP cyclohydrolase II RibA [Deltaproteobacteria bacterium]